jgi:hypothetical protein
LFETYPSFRDIEFIYYYNPSSKKTFVANPTKNTISFNLFYYETADGHGTLRLQDKVKRIFAHELQHFIQRAEGLSEGSTQIREFRRLVESDNRIESELSLDEREYYMEVAQRSYLEALGEVEARDVSNRINLSDSERLEIKPDGMFEKGGKVSSWEMPDASILRYGQKLKDNHPEIWDAGGNITGNESFENLKEVSKRGYWLESEKEFYGRWQSFMARHQHNHNLAGVVANIKWASWGNIGEAKAKEVVEGSNKFEQGGMVNKSVWYRKYNGNEPFKTSVTLGKYGSGIYFSSQKNSRFEGEHEIECVVNYTKPYTFEGSILPNLEYHRDREKSGLSKQDFTDSIFNKGYDAIIVKHKDSWGDELIIRDSTLVDYKDITHNKISDIDYKKVSEKQPFLNYSNNVVKEKFGSVFKDGFPIFSHNSENEILQGYGELENGSHVKYDKENLDWIIDNSEKFEEGGKVEPNNSFRDMCNRDAMDKYDAVIDWDMTFVYSKDGEVIEAVGEFYDGRKFEIKTEDLEMRIVEEYLNPPETFENGGKVEKPHEKPVFDFMKSNPMGQAKAIKLLSKLIRADGVVLTNYKWIEGFERGLKVETSKINSSKSEKGYVEKPVIGNRIVDSKAEQDYYIYLENGGETYTKFLERKSDYDSVIAKKENAERDIKNAERESKQKEANEKYKLAKENEIKSYIENGIEPTLSKRLSFFQNKIEQLKSKRSTDSQKEEIAFNERMIEQTKEQVQKSYKIATELYVIINGEVEKKYDWKVGDKVIYDGRIETVIEQVTVNHLHIAKDVAYKVEKREGIHNQYISYDGLFPVSASTQEANKENKEAEIINDLVLNYGWTKKSDVSAKKNVKGGTTGGDGNPSGNRIVIASFDTDNGKRYLELHSGWDRVVDISIDLLEPKEASEKFNNLVNQWAEFTKEKKKEEIREASIVPQFNQNELNDAIQALEISEQLREANKLKLLSFVIDRLINVQDLKPSMVEAKAKELGLQHAGHAEAKLVKEVVELATILYAKGQSFEDCVDIYNLQSTLKQRTSESVLLQQYSTSLPIAYTMGKFCGIDKEGQYFEPSAGNGMLTIIANPKNFTVNEIDKDRLWSLKKQGFKQILNQDGKEPFDLGKFDAIITNPPFGNNVKPAIANGVKLEKLEHVMVANCLKHLKDNGKSAIIVGGHLEYKEKGIKGLQDWFFFIYLASSFNVVDIINIDSHKLYYKMGTTFPLKVILIDGVKKDMLPSPKEIEKYANGVISDWISKKDLPQSEKFSTNLVDSFYTLNKRVNG